MRIKARIKPVIKPDSKYHCPHCGKEVGGSYLVPAYYFKTGYTPVEIDRNFICPNCWVGANIEIWCKNRIWKKIN